MKNVHDLALKTNLNNAQGSTCTQSDLDKYNFVWGALIDMFGRGFTSSYGIEPPRMWKEAIRRLSAWQLRWVIGQIGQSDMDFPPNLSQFNSKARNAPLQLTAAEQSNLDRRRLIEDGYGKIKTLEFQVKNIKEEKFRADAEKRLNEAKRDYMEAKQLPVLGVFE